MFRSTICRTKTESMQVVLIQLCSHILPKYPVICWPAFKVVKTTAVCRNLPTWVLSFSSNQSLPLNCNISDRTRMQPKKKLSSFGVFDTEKEGWVEGLQNDNRFTCWWAVEKKKRSRTSGLVFVWGAGAKSRHHFGRKSRRLFWSFRAFFYLFFYFLPEVASVRLKCGTMGIRWG